MLNIITERPVTRKIVKVENENYRTKTFTIEAEDIAKKANPGQYVMLWVPGKDEIPMSISGLEGENVKITVARVGDATSALHEMKVGDLVGLRGPYGKGFSLDYEKVVIVGGGYGVAPLAWLAEELVSLGAEIYFVLGAKKRDDIILYDRVKKVSKELVITTEDGSMGLKGLATDGLEILLSRIATRPEAIYTCGPEKMMVKVIEKAFEIGIDVEASLERYMKCGIGICGSCALGHLRVCVEGPVLRGSEIEKVKEELGRFKLDSSSRKIEI